VCDGESPKAELAIDEALYSYSASTNSRLCVSGLAFVLLNSTHIRFVVAYKAEDEFRHDLKNSVSADDNVEVPVFLPLRNTIGVGRRGTRGNSYRSQMLKAPRSCMFWRELDFIFLCYHCIMGACLCF